MDPDAVAKAFVGHYYRTFDCNRVGLGKLYQDNSMLTFEGENIRGPLPSSPSSPPFSSSSASTLYPPSIASPPVPPVACSSSSADPSSSPARTTHSNLARCFI